MKGNKKVLFLSILLIIASIVIIVMAYMLYQTTDANVDNGQTSTEGSTENSYSIYQEGYSKSFSQYFTSYYDDYIGNVEVIKEINFKDDEMSGGYIGLISVYLDSSSDVYLNIDSESELADTYGTNYKIASDVANIYVCTTGNGGFSDEIVLIHNDGTVSIISADSMGAYAYGTAEALDLTPQIIENATNVVTLIEEQSVGGHSYYLVDINGNFISPNL